MLLTGSSKELAMLKAFSPLDGMRPETLLALARRTQRLQAPRGRLLFTEGDEGKHTFYLLSGTIDLLREGEVVSTVRSATAKAKNPLAHALPRPYSAVVTSDRVEYLHIDSEFLDVAVTWDQTGSYQVAELRAAVEEAPSGEDWMTALLQTKAFHKIPPANIQAVFMRLQRVDHRAGDVVIKQGDVGDYFYVVVKGRCVVTRETPLNRDGVKLAELRMGDTFGEEALICEAKRNATVTMATDGAVMRLGKEDFRQLLHEPFLHWIEYADAKRIAAEGGQWIDVRLPSEFEHYHAPEAVNIPMHSLRLRLKSLDRDRRYIVCCDTGRRSSACAYLLSERGFHASVLRGGLSATELARSEGGGNA
ncbi:MAG TPA: cyclic nucleotide-binding domain-containing protein [Steroidobacter sp.]|jgi:CRP-like cAMP-binding protein|nr:cyclic nucleotide-binding domain-containing protein [Steroidobacteraceae bacterium]HLS81181.1 cyclic nucleotide-binding domain-containing protein [Steroidobacter sp.]